MNHHKSSTTTNFNTTKLGMSPIVAVIFLVLFFIGHFLVLVSSYRYLLFTIIFLKGGIEIDPINRKFTVTSNHSFGVKSGKWKSLENSKRLIYFEKNDEKWTTQVPRW